MPMRKMSFSIKVLCLYRRPQLVFTPPPPPNSPLNFKTPYYNPLKIKKKGYILLPL